jgi:acyl-CoA thioesterase
LTEDSKTSDNVAELRAGERIEPVARFLQTKLLDLSPGHCRVSMRVRPEYVNFNGLVFGGIIMALADEAFAYATNSLLKPSYASQVNIHFLNAPSLNDELIAECRVLKSGRRVGISEMEVVNQDGKVIARATGTTIPVITEAEAR